MEILNRVRSVAFPQGSSLLGPVHILDLDKNGYIKPHIDSVKVKVSFQTLGKGCVYLVYGLYLLLIALILMFQFCGSTIAGLNLLSDSVMRLVKEDDSNEWLCLMLPRCSLYIIRYNA